MPELEITVLESLLRMAPKKPGLFSDIDQKGILQKSLLLEALEIVTCHWGGWVTKEDVTISKQTNIIYSRYR